MSKRKQQKRPTGRLCDLCNGRMHSKTNILCGRCAHSAGGRWYIQQLEQRAQLEYELERAATSTEGSDGDGCAICARLSTGVPLTFDEALDLMAGGEHP